MTIRRPSALLLVFLALAVSLGAGLIGWAIGRATAEEAATVTVTGGETRAEEEPGFGTSPMGRQVYVNAGCSACHGLNAEGTDVGPSLAGHTAEQVHQQVRSPLAQMPGYPPEQLSDEDLDMVAGYIAGLEPMEEHVEPVKLSEVAAVHHWMATARAHGHGSAGPRRGDPPDPALPTDGQGSGPREGPSRPRAFAGGRLPRSRARHR